MEHTIRLGIDIKRALNQNPAFPIFWCKSVKEELYLVVFLSFSIEKWKEDGATEQMQRLAQRLIDLLN